MKRNGDKYDLIFVEQVFHLVEQQMLLKEKLALKKGKIKTEFKMRKAPVIIGPGQ